jgi:hypothetical protein
MAVAHGRVVGTRSRWWRRAALVVSVPLVAAPVVVSLSASASARGTYTAYLPNLQILVPYSSGQISIGTSPDTGDPQLQFTHDTYDAGFGPFEIKPHYDHKTGVATFSQIISKTKNGGNSWRPAYSVPIAATGVYQPGTSHYAFPLTSFKLFVENPDGSQGAFVAASPKIDYCITGDTNIGGPSDTPNNAIPPDSNCSNPRKVLGWSPGWADQYDQTDPGQPIDLGPSGLANGNYILQGMVDPEGLFAETGKSDNVTDTYLTVTGGTVTVTGQTGPTAPQPTATLQYPVPRSRVSGSVVLRARAKTVSSTPVYSVQYLLDGAPLGAPVTTAPYTYPWTVGTTTPGPHQLSARVTDADGRMGTAPVETVNVAPRSASSSIELASAADDPAPAVVVVNPVPGETLSGTATLAANASDNVAVRSVQFLVDGTPLGAPVTSAPYAVQWNTSGTVGGHHTVSAVATSARGATSTSALVAVTVQNPAPPMACFVMDTHVSAIGGSTVRSPAFHTASSGETLVAFVTGDGGGQHVTVSGAGLNWKLVRQAHDGSGDAEIWTAQAPRVLSRAHVTSSLVHPRWYHQQLTVIGMEGVSGVGASASGSSSTGSPTVDLMTKGRASLVFAVTDGQGAPAGALPKGWVRFASSWHDAVGRSGWSETTNQPTGIAGTTVSVTSPTPFGARWNTAAVELLNDGG